MTCSPAHHLWARAQSPWTFPLTGRPQSGPAGSWCSPARLRSSSPRTGWQSPWTLWAPAWSTQPTPDNLQPASSSSLRPAPTPYCDRTPGTSTTAGERSTSRSRWCRTPRRACRCRCPAPRRTGRSGCWSAACGRTRRSCRCIRRCQRTTSPGCVSPQTRPSGSAWLSAGTTKCRGHEASARRGCSWRHPPATDLTPELGSAPPWRGSGTMQAPSARGKRSGALRDDVETSTSGNVLYGPWTCKTYKITMNEARWTLSDTSTTYTQTIAVAYLTGLSYSEQKLRQQTKISKAHLHKVHIHSSTSRLCLILSFHEGLAPKWQKAFNIQHLVVFMISQELKNRIK